METTGSVDLTGDNDHAVRSTDSRLAVGGIHWNRACRENGRESNGDVSY